MDPTKRGRGDWLTIASVAAVAQVVATLLHEAAGHGGACLAVGGRALLITSVNMECSVDHRLATAGGTIANLVAAAVFCAWGRAVGRKAAAWRYFLWLSMTMNLFVVEGCGGGVRVGGV